MSNLGTLWFGADIDLTALKQKIQSGNQGILDALKIDYDPKSYQDMVSRLRSELAKETFSIKISTDIPSARQSVQETLRQVGQLNKADGNLGALTGVRAATRDILEQRDAILSNKQSVWDLKEAWGQAIAQYGRNSAQAKKAFSAYDTARRDLQVSKFELEGMRIASGKASLAQKALNDQMKNASSAARQLNSDSVRLNATLFGGIHVSSQLGSVLNTLFAVHAARQFLDNVIEIGGQLEKQRISMQAIIGDAARANDLFGQIKELAIKSPFGVVELDQYSKQLAAYGIEQTELFNMTKRLADISAGAGQDIGRLALALGHVKSATYLTGITLRQFSMNNIPMLKMLADYYSEVEQRIVSTAEVQKRISQRQVSYEDVIEQIKRMTDEGGMFYNMQEKISESLSAKFKNLKDSFDIMYGEIAESDIGTFLKRFAEAATALSRQWRVVFDVIATGVVWFGAAKAAALLYNHALVINNNALGIFARSTAKLTAEQVENLLVTGEITREQLLNAVASKRLTVSQAELAASTFGVTRAQLQEIASSGKVNKALLGNAIATSKYSVTQLRLIASLKANTLHFEIFGRRVQWLDKVVATSNGKLNAFGRSLLNLRIFGLGATSVIKTIGATIMSLAPQLAIFTGISLVVESIIDSERRAEEEQQRLLDMSERANEAYRNLREVQDKVSMTPEQRNDDANISSAIDEITESLKRYSYTADETFKNAFAIDNEGKSINSLSYQYEILYSALDKTVKGYEEFNKMKPMIQESIKSSDTELDWLTKLGGKLFNWMLPDEELRSFRTLKESLDLYVKSVNEAYVSEQKLLRSRLELNSALQNMGYESVVGMNPDEFLKFLRTMKDEMPDAFEELSSNVPEYVENALDSVADSWAKLEFYTIEGSNRMRKTGEDFKKSMEVAYGEDSSKWPDYWKDVVYSAMEEATREIKGFSELSIDAQNRIRNAYLKPFGIEVDTSTAHEKINNLLVELQNLVGRSWIVKIGVKGENVVDDLDAAVKAYQKTEKELESLNNQKRNKEKRGETSDETYLKIVKQTNDALAEQVAQRELINHLGGDLPKKKTTTGGGGGRGGSKVDKQLQEWKKQVSLLEKYRQQIDKLRQYMTRAEAEAKMAADGNFKSLFGLFTNPNDYMGSLNELIAKLGTAGERGAYARELLAKAGEEDLRLFAENTDNANSELQRMLDIMQENYNVYKKWSELTGNKKLAAQIAGITENSSYSSYLIEEYKKLAGANSLSAESFFGLSESKAKEFGEKSDLFLLWKEWQENNKKLREDDLQLYEEAIKNSKRYEDNIADINAELERTIEAIKKINQDPLEQRRLIENAETNANKKKADEAWKNFKETEDWGRIFSNLDNVTDATLSNMYDKLVEILPKVKDSVEATKALYEAMDKIRDAMNTRNPFSALASNLSQMAAFREVYKKLDLGNANAGDQISLDKATAKRLGLGEDAWTGTVGEFLDAMRMAGNNFEKIVGSIGTTFQGLQKVLQPVIDLFDALGNTTLSDFFQIGSNALGAAAGVAGGLNQLKGLFKGSGVGNFLSAAGPYAAVAGAGLSIVSSLFAMHDAALQEEIEASQQRQKEMENLTKNLQTTLERTLGGIYNYNMSKSTKDLLSERKSELLRRVSFGDFFGFDTSALKKIIKEINDAMANDDYYKAQRLALQAQQDELERQMALEEDKKDADESRIADYKQHIAELQDEIDNFALDMAKALWDIDIHSWAQELTDAIVEAWKSGEDAVEAYRSKVKDMMLDLTKNIVAQKVLEQTLENLHLDTLIAGIMDAQSGKLDYDNVEQIADVLMQAGDLSAEAITAILDAMEAKGYISKGEGTSKTSSKVIQGGFTENETGLLLSYVNAIRADVSVQRVDVGFLRLLMEQTAQRQNVIAEAQTQQMRQIAANTLRNADAADAIYHLLDLARKDKSFGFKIQ